MTTEAIGSGFDMGRVLRRTVETVRANLLTFGLIALVLNALPQAISATIQLGIQRSQENIGVVALLGLLSLVIFIVTIGASLVSICALTFGSLASLNGKPLSIPQCIRGGAPHWWRVLLIFLLQGLLIVLGLLVLVVPGLILMMRWYVAMPVQIAEGLGARASMGRSARLTDGRRWPLFGLSLAIGVAFLTLELVLLGLAGGFTGAFTGMFSGPAASLVVLPLIQLIAAPVNAALYASVYFELTGGAAGSRPNVVAAVFD